MIRMQVNAVFQIRDGFAGRIIEGGNLICMLDGVSVRPVSKPGGYLIFTNLPAGAHQLRICAAGYQDEYVDFTTDGSCREFYVALKPGRQYLFRQSVTRLHLQLNRDLKNRQIWIGAPCALECKVAQAKAEAGSTQFRIYCKGSPALLPVPGTFLIEDGENSEIVVLKSLSEEVGVLEAPLCKDHSRSRRILPVQAYRCDEQAEIHAAFALSGAAVVYTGSGEPQSQELTEGDNQWTLSK